MKAEQNMVREFHEKYRFTANPINDEPKLLPPPIFEKRLQFLREEVDELAEAMYKPDLTDQQRLILIADALGDVAYLLIGDAVAFGIELEPIFAEIHRSNMTKERAHDID